MERPREAGNADAGAGAPAADMLARRFSRAQATVDVLDSARA